MSATFGAQQFTALESVFLTGGILEPYRLGKGHIVPPPFFLYLLSNYHQTWHANTMAQNLSKTVIVKSIVTSQ